MRDPYSTLGVEKSADTNEIKAAFRKLAKKYHPDANPSNAKAKERFAAVSRAYEILGDEEKRRRFDGGEIDADGNERATYPGGNPFANSEAGFDDIFRRYQRSGAGAGKGFGAEDVLRTMFGGGRGGAGFAGAGDPLRGGASGQGAHNAQQAKPAKGRDVRVNLPITIEQILSTDKVKLALPNGRTIAVKIPDGVVDGQTIRLAGQGETGQAGHQGDVLACVVIKASETYRLENGVLVMQAEVPLETVAKGGKLPVATPAGKVALKVKPWLADGRSFRMKGRGLPVGGGKRGDLRVELVVSFSGMSERQKQELTAALDL
ncbi:MAG: DnaJ C-terminal domain-containing protein [Pseudomonadota bacterium]